MTVHHMSTSRRSLPTDVVGLAPPGTHLARLDRDKFRTARVRGWGVDGRPMVYDHRAGRLVPIDATDFVLHDPPDELLGCDRCNTMRLRAQRVPKAVT